MTAATPVRSTTVAAPVLLPVETVTAVLPDTGCDTPRDEAVTVLLAAPWVINTRLPTRLAVYVALPLMALASRPATSPMDVSALVATVLKLLAGLASVTV